MEGVNKDFLHSKNLVAGEVLGRGSFGTVYRCTEFGNDGTMGVYAVKVINLKLLKLEQKESLKRLDREVRVMQKLNHPNIVRLYSTHRTPDAMFLIMELVLGIDLYEMITAKNGLKNEDEARFIFKHVSQAVVYMHEQGVLHRDIKPENVIIQNEKYNQNLDKREADSSESKSSSKFNYSVKLIDFGLSKVIGDIKTESDSTRAMDLSEVGSVANSLVGTPRYVAPEIVDESVKEKMHLQSNTPHCRKSYTAAVDCYSMGVLLHVMLGACFPQFDNATVYFKDPRVARISEDGKDLITKLLEKDPSKRLSIGAALKSHPWLNEKHLSRQTVNSKGMEEETLGKSGSLSFEEFQDKLLKELERDSVGDGAVSLVGTNTESSVVEISVGADVASRLKGMDDENTKEDEKMAEHITGLKRQASQEAEGSAEMAHSFPTDNRGHNIYDTEDSKASIEIDLPGAKPGVWGISQVDSEDSRDHGQSSDRKQNSKLQEEDSPGTDVAEVSKVPHFLPQEGTIAATMEDPDRLLSLQANIAASLKAAFLVYGQDPKIAPGIVASAVGSRELLREAEGILKKLDHTAQSVIAMLPDLQLAVEEGEFDMARTFFNTIKEWIHSLKDEAKALLRSNVGVIASVNNTILLVREHNREVIRARERAQPSYAPATSVDLKQTEVNVVTSLFANTSFASGKDAISNDSTTSQKEAAHSNEPSPDNMAVAFPVVALERPHIPENSLNEALQKLQEVDQFLQQHASFWSHMEIVIQILMQRANHVDSLTNYTKNPRVRGRYMQRLGEYGETWNRVRLMCQSFTKKSNSITPYLYKFLQDPVPSPGVGEVSL